MILLKQKGKAADQSLGFGIPNNAIEIFAPSRAKSNGFRSQPKPSKSFALHTEPTDAKSQLNI